MQILQTKPTKPNLPNQTHLTKPTKPKLLVKAVNAWVRSAFGNVLSSPYQHSNIWNDKGGRSTPIIRIIVLSWIEAFKERQRNILEQLGGHFLSLSVAKIAWCSSQHSTPEIREHSL